MLSELVCDQSFFQLAWSHRQPGHCHAGKKTNLWFKQVSARLPGVAHRQSLCVTSRVSACLDKHILDHDVGGYSDMMISFAIIPQAWVFVSY